jgi:hypothetical protein
MGVIVALLYTLPGVGVTKQVAEGIVTQYRFEDFDGDMHDRVK